MSTEAHRIAVQLGGGRANGYARRISSFGPEWIGREEACRILHCSINSFANFRYRGDFDAIDTRPASHIAESAAACGLLLRRSDVERVAAIRKRCRVGLSSAARIWGAIKAGGPL